MVLAFGRLSEHITILRETFEGQNFHGLLTGVAAKKATPPNFSEKSFVNSYKTSKFAKVFSLESFPLYGNCHYNVTLCPSSSGTNPAIDTLPTMIDHLLASDLLCLEPTLCKYENVLFMAQISIFMGHISIHS